MKTMIEYLTTMIILTIMMFSFSGIVLSEIQIIQARNEHTYVIEKLETIDSYDEESINEFKNNLEHKDNFNFVINDNKVYVDYNFDINLPIIGEIEDNKIIGYAR